MISGVACEVYNFIQKYLFQAKIHFLLVESEIRTLDAWDITLRNTYVCP